MRPRPRWAPKQPARLRPATGPGTRAGSILHPVPSGDGGEVPAAGPRDPSPAYRGKHRAPAAEDPAGSAAADGAVVVEEAVAAERARIARDLHDSVDKTLHGIALAATSLAASLTGQDGPADAESLGPRLRELASFARYAISETRCVIYDLRDDAFSAPLGDMVRSVATAWSSGAGVPVSLAVPPDADAAGESRREIIAILREALRNVEMHAHATRVRVSMRKAAERLLLTISDNGAGFSLPADPERLQATAHYGLIGMTERARKLGGTLVIRSRPGHGTRIAVQVPADAAETAR